MKKFMVVFLGSESSANATKWETLDEATKAKREEQGIKAWMKWGEDNQSAIIDMGTPLGTTKHIDQKGILNVTNNMTGYTIIQAESHEAAAKLFLNHPHFSIFPGDSVEVMECLPLPEM